MTFNAENLVRRRTRRARLYRELAPWWRLFSPVEEGARGARRFVEILRKSCAGPCRSVVEFGAGAGGNAFYLKKHFQMTLIDLAPEMLDESRTINHECEHVAADMRDARLGRQFDAVLIRGAVAHLTTEKDLRSAVETAYLHCKPGGAAVVAPDFVRENFRLLAAQGWCRGAGGRALRWLTWSFDPNPADATYNVHHTFLLEEGATARVEHDEHVRGLFARAVWRRTFERAGFCRPEIVAGPDGQEVFVARKEASS